MNLYTRTSHSFWYVPCDSNVGQLIAYPLARILLKSLSNSNGLSLLPLLTYTPILLLHTHTIRRELQHYFDPSYCFKDVTCYLRATREDERE